MFTNFFGTTMSFLIIPPMMNGWHCSDTWQRLRTGRRYQNCHAPCHATHTPSRKFVIACAVMASPRRFLRNTSH